MSEGDKYSGKTGSKKHVAFDSEDLPTCAVCVDVLGSNGGPASLACGHNGCLGCLQKVQMHSVTPLCPLCRTPFDAELSLGLNLDLREVLERAETATAATCAVEAESERMAAMAAQQDASHAMALVETGERPRSRMLMYDLPLPEETGAWIPVSVPPKGFKDSGGVYYGGDFSGQVGGWYADRAQCDEERRDLPEVNLWNVLNGLINIISGTTRLQTSHEDTSVQTWPDFTTYNSPRTRLMARDNTRIQDHIPSAPPLLSGPNEHVRGGIRSILEAEPPQWVPDSAATTCMQCTKSFRPLACARHHCRFCGGLFCGECSSRWCLLPLNFRENDPQRVCGACCERLDPVQHMLADRVSNAAQLATHDVTDMSCMRAWVNSPLGITMEHEIYKATNTLRSYYKIGRIKPEKSIPDAVLRGAKGLAILTVLKAGFMVTYKIGTGLVVARRSDGTWSAPSAIASCGVGWGPQAGGELTDFIIVLRTARAVKAFGGRVHLAVGAGLSVAAGPMGRAAEADVRAGDGGAAACYTYSRSKGAFVGCSLEGNVVATRSSANISFYGDPTIRPVDLLMGGVGPPRAAAPLYSALSQLFANH